MADNENLIKSIDSTQRYSEVKEGKLLWRYIRINEEAEWKQIISVLIHYFVMTYIYVGMDSLQPIYLNDILGIDKDSSGEINSNILIADTGVKLITACGVGLFIEKVKRRTICLLSLSGTCGVLILLPFAANGLVAFIALRIVYAVFSIGLSILPLIADYVHPSSKGRISSICIITAGLGAFAGAVVNKKILENYSVKVSYVSMGISAPVIGFLYSLTFKEVKRNYREMNLTTNIKRLTTPFLSTAYALSLLSRADSLLLTTYLTIWCKKYISDEKEANVHSQTLSGIAYCFLFVFAVGFGFLIERKNKQIQNLILLASCIATGIISVFIEYPGGVLMYVLISLCGINFAGLQVNSLYLVNTYVDQDLRGKAMSMWGFAGVFGILLFSTIGSTLSDDIGAKVIFISFGALAAVVFIGISVMVLKKYHLEGDEK